MLDVGTGTGPRGAAARARRRAGDRRRRVGGDAGRSRGSAPPTQLRRRSRFSVGDAHALEFRRSQLRRGRQPARADAHARVATLRRRAVPRRRCAWSIVDYPSATSVALLRVDGAARRRMPLGVHDRAVPRVHAIGDRRARSIATASASARCTGSSCCRSRSTRRSDRARFTRRSEHVLDRARPAQALRIAGHARRRTVRVLVTGATGFTGGHLARAPRGARRRGVARWCATERPRAAALANAGIELVTGDLRDRAALGARDRRRRRRLSHRRDLPAGRPRRRRLPRRQRDRGRRRRRGGGARRRPPRRALQHGRRPRRHRASAGRTRTRRSSRATSTRSPSSKASGSPAKPARGSASR